VSRRTNENPGWYSQPVRELPDHREAQVALSVQDFAYPGRQPCRCDEILVATPQLLHPELDRIHRVRRIDGRISIHQLRVSGRKDVDALPPDPLCPRLSRVYEPVRASSPYYEEPESLVSCECSDLLKVVSQKAHDRFSRAVATTDPDNLWRMPEHQATLMKIGILRYDEVVVGPGVVPHRAVERRRQADR